MYGQKSVRPDGIDTTHVELLGYQGRDLAGQLGFKNVSAQLCRCVDKSPDGCQQPLDDCRVTFDGCSQLLHVGCKLPHGCLQFPHVSREIADGCLQITDGYLLSFDGCRQGLQSAGNLQQLFRKHLPSHRGAEVGILTDQLNQIVGRVDGYHVFVTCLIVAHPSTRKM